MGSFSLVTLQGWSSEGNKNEINAIRTISLCWCVAHVLAIGYSLKKLGPINTRSVSKKLSSAHARMI